MGTVRKIRFILPVIALCIITGCSKEEKISAGDPGATAATQSAAAQGTTDGEEAGVPEDACYRYEISYPAQTQEQYGQILTALLGSESTWQQASETASTVDGGDAIYWQAAVDGIRHEWYLNQSCFSYSNDLTHDPVDEAEAEEIVEQFLAEAGLEAVPDTTVTGNFGNLTETVLVYRLTVDDLPVMGAVSLSFTDAEEEIPLTGSYLRVTVGAEGICSLSLYPLPDLGAALETYDPSADFLSVEEAEAQAGTYVQESAELHSYTEEILSAEGKLIYMPTRQGTKVLLIPAYEIEVMGQKDGAERVHLILMDAQSGFVYHHGWNYMEQTPVEWTGEK